MATRIRIVGACDPPFIWPRSTRDGTEWMGQGAYFFRLFQEALPSYDIVTDLPQSNVTLPAIQSLADGRADVCAANYGVTYDRFNLVDFSYPVTYAGLSIISTRSETVSGDAFSGIFDRISYILFLLSYILLAMVLWAFIRPYPSESFSKTIFYTATTIVSHPLPKSFLSHSLRSKSLSVFITVIALFANTMYSCVVMSKMMSKQELETIDTLGDLQYKLTDKRILVFQQSYIDDFLKAQADIYSSLAPRIDYYIDAADSLFYEKMLGQVERGSHVLITHSDKFFRYHSMMSMEMQCRMPKRRFRLSREPLSNVMISWLYRKGLESAETIDKKLMWLSAFGLLGRLSKKDGGIISPKMTLSDECPEMEDYSERDSARCGFGDSSPNTVQTSLGLDHTGKVFLVLVVGFGLATISFVMEVCLARVKSKTKPNNA